MVYSIARRLPTTLPIRHVIIYKGHEKHHLLGPYADNIEKRIRMFHGLNPYREALGMRKWVVTPMAGERLVAALKDVGPKETLLVIPAGQSTRLDQVFSSEETQFLKEEFFFKGGRGYFNCGSAYWVSSLRVYSDLCEEQPGERRQIVKTSRLALFQGITQGPLCPYPGHKYRVGFFSDAVEVEDEKQSKCTILLSGGGWFLPYAGASQKVRVLARYNHRDLMRHGKTKEECSHVDKASILISTGQGAALLSMFHPYYNAKDIDTEAYMKAFPDSGTDWKRVHAALSPEDVRMRFVLNTLLGKLEAMDFGDERA